MNYKYNELEYAKIIYENGLQDHGHLPAQLRLTAIYMRRILGYKPKKLKEEFYAWCERNIPGYQPALHYKAVNRAISQAVKKGSTLVSLPFVPVFQKELDYIHQISSISGPYEYPCRKLLFTLLVQMKANQVVAAQRDPDRSPSGKDLFFKGGQRKYAQLKKIAALPENLRINEDLIHALYLSGLVTPMYGGMIRLDFMRELPKDGLSQEEPCFLVEDLEHIGRYFDYYHRQPRIALCACCKRPFYKKSNSQVYCCETCYKTSNRIRSRMRMQDLRQQAVCNKGA